MPLLDNPNLGSFNEPPPGGYNQISSNLNNNNNNNNFSFNANNFGPPSTPPPPPGDNNNGMSSSIQHEYWSPSKNQDGMNNWIQKFDDSNEELYHNGYEKYRNIHCHDWSLEQSLTRVFNYSQFRAFQREICTALLDGKDCLVIMPTGYGKSITYQIPVIAKKNILNGKPQTTIVISPLVSLIQDQVYQLNEAGVKAVAFGSIEMDEFGNCDPAKQSVQSDNWRKALHGEFELIYITPEKLDLSQWMTTLISRLYEQHYLQAFAIDEAHCISQWGHDFRKSYLKLDKIKGKYPHIPIIALTATATSTVITDVITGLRITGCMLFRQNMNRPNLFWEVREKKKGYREEIVKIIKNNYINQCGIIYCLARKECEQLHEYLRDKRIKSVVYHAGLPDNERAQNQMEWTCDNTRIVIATCAFGMGINKYDVRFVIHTSMPKSIEDYYQQAGRAGRDGAPSRCILYFSQGDRFRIEWLIHQCSDNGGDRPQEAIERDEKKLWDMMYYCQNTVDCRRAILLQFFDDEFSRDQCSMDINTLEYCKHRKIDKHIIDNKYNKKHWRGCDNCCEHSLHCYQEEDVTNFSLDICNIVKALQYSMKKSYDNVVKIFRGSKAKEIKAIVGDHLNGFGKGKDFSITDTRRLIAKLLSKQILKERITPTKMGGNTSEMILGNKYSSLTNGNVKIFLRMRQKDKEQRKKSISKRNKARNASIAELDDDDDQKTNSNKKKNKKSKRKKNKKKQIDEYYAKDESNSGVDDDSDDLSPTDHHQASLTQTIMATPGKEINGFALTPLTTGQAGYLQVELTSLRRKLKEQHNIRNFHSVFSDVVMAKLAKFAPVTIDDLSHFDGFTDKKLEKFGDEIIDSIREHLDQNALMSPFNKVPEQLRISKKESLKQKANKRRKMKKRGKWKYY